MLAPTVARDRILVRFRSDAVAAALLMALAFGLRVASFGDPNLHVDETFYFYVAERMHQGALLYVDIWDRKPPGLFLIYYLIVGVWDNVLSYQIAATLFIGLTAYVIFRMSITYVNWVGAFFSACVYEIMVGPFQGFGGQASIFYNLFVALAALLVLSALSALRTGIAQRKLFAAFLLLGVAVTIKQTTVFEGIYFGCFCAVLLIRARGFHPATLKEPAIWALLGALPFGLCGLAFLFLGHFYEFWYGMVTSNFAKEKPDFIAMAARSMLVATKVIPLLCLAVLSIVAPHSGAKGKGERSFFIGWLAAAFVGFLSVPNFYVHYGLSLIAPFCVLGAAFLARPLGLLAVAGIAWTSTIWHNPFGFYYTPLSRASMAVMSKAIAEHRQGRPLFVYDGPILLYTLTGTKALTPLAFPPHLNHVIERNVSHLNTMSEVARVLALRPGAVVLSKPVRSLPANWETRRMVFKYVTENCHHIGDYRSFGALGVDPITIYGDCRP